MMIRPALAMVLPALLSLAASPAFAQPSAKAVDNAPVNSGIQTPMDDLGLRKNAIPPILLEAVEKPYSLEGLHQCGQIVAAVEQLNTMLGKDIDLPQDSGSRLAASDLMDFAASSVIPFRGLIREVTGASGRQRQLQEAVLAGFARRSFLKGVGQVRNCAYPAHPANEQIIAQQTAAIMASLEAMCGPLPNGQKRSAREEWLNSRKCAEYKRIKAQGPQPAAVTSQSPPSATRK